MKAAVLEEWQNLVVKDIGMPEILPDEALIKVSCAGICGSDVHIFNGDNPIAKTPVIPGHEFAGEIVKIYNTKPTEHTVGSRVVSQPLVSCGSCAPCRRGQAHVCEKLTVIGVNQNGGFAQYVSVPVDTLFQIPEGMPNSVAVLAEPFSIGYHACSRGSLQAGQRVLINGAGPIGLYAGIVATEFGAIDVVFSEPVAERRVLAESFGFSAVDPSQTGLLKCMREHSSGEGFDLIVEASGSEQAIDFAIEVAAVRGSIVTLGFPAKNYAAYNITRGIVKELSLIGSRVCTREEFRKTLALLNKLYSGGEVDFERMVSEPRTLADLAQSISATEKGDESTKVLINPSLVA